MDPAALRALADAYTAPMTSIRGRRVHRLILRELGGFDSVERDGDTLRARSADGSAASLTTDGRGNAYEILRTAPDGTRTATSYDALKDSLPIISQNEHRGLEGAVLQPGQMICSLFVLSKR